MSRLSRGFTLIELMVVIAIISLLSSITLSSMSAARSKGRDAQRLSEIRQLQNALEIYYTTYGRYPSSTTSCATSPNNSWQNSVECLSGGRWISDSATSQNLSTFISADPTDPGQVAGVPPFPSGAYYYFSSNYDGGTNANQWYIIVFALENPNRAVENIDGITTPDGQFFHYGNGTNGVVTVGRSPR